MYLALHLFLLVGLIQLRPDLEIDGGRENLVVLVGILRAVPLEIFELKLHRLEGLHFAGLFFLQSLAISLQLILQCLGFVQLEENFIGIHNRHAAGCLLRAGRLDQTKSNDQESGNKTIATVG